MFIIMAFFGCTFMSCNNAAKERKAENKQGFELIGTIKDFTGKVKFSIDYGQKVLENIDITDGTFSFSYDFPIPTELTVEAENGEFFIRFWAENVKMTLDITKLEKPKNPYQKYNFDIKGGEFQAGEDHYRAALAEFKKTQPDEWKLREKSYDPNLSEKEKKEVEEQMKKVELAGLEFQKKYIRENSTNPFCAQLVYQRLTSKIGGESAKELKAWADPIDVSIRNHPYVKKMFDMLNNMLATEGGLEKFVAGVPNFKYKVDPSYKGSKHKNVKYLAMMNNNNLCALTSDFGVHDNYNAHGKGKNEAAYNFIVQIINPEGDEVKRFPVKANGLASSIAVDAQNNIYVLATLQKEIETKFRGRVSKYLKNVGVECMVFNAKGEKLREYKLGGREYATGARIYKDKLMVSDVGTQALGMYNIQDGKLLSTIDDLRPCCSILDFDVSPDGQVLAANLGSFRVDGYKLTGEKIVSFGKRGRSLDDFHSCCNPVSVRKLHNGAVITVEKAPTRIKVYTEAGATLVQGIEELVDGCFHIPVMSDKNSNIYLASPDKGLVKCVVI